MIVIREPSKEDIDYVMFDEEIYSRIADDKCPSMAVTKSIFPYHLFDWYGIYLDDEVIGIANIEADGRFHFQVLKDFRRKSRKALEKILEIIDRDIYCEIPTRFRSVINFAINNGFEKIGRVDRYFVQNGVYYPRIKLIYKK